MKEAIKYLEREVKKLAAGINDSIHIAYEFDESTDTFFVEVLPEAKYGEASLTEDLADIILDFESTFPDYSICFISNDPLVKLQQPTVIVDQNTYDTLNTFLDCWAEVINVNRTQSKFTEAFRVHTVLHSGLDNKIEISYRNEPGYVWNYDGFGECYFNNPLEEDKGWYNSQFGRKKKKENKHLKAA